MRLLARNVLTPLKTLLRYHSGSSCTRVRFAPSPTGQLHLGGLRTALYNYLFAKSRGGQFILRIEDTDQSRLVPGAADNLEDVLDWLGLSPDESPRTPGNKGPYSQSERLDKYRDSAQQLMDAGHAYKCFCSEKRLDLLRREALRNRESNRYDGRCAALGPEEIKEKLDTGMAYTVRFKLSPFTESFDDLVFGSVAHDVHKYEGDPIIMKSDGFPTYHLANVVDDHLMGVSHVLRGVEWQVSTPKHLLMYKAFGWVPPAFAHLPLIMNSDGTKLSKRQGDLHIRNLKEDGFFPEAVLNFVTLVGGGFVDKEYSLEKLFSMKELCEMFSIDKIHAASCKIEMGRLADLNRVALKERLNCAEKRKELVTEARSAILAAVEGLERSSDLLNDERIEKYLIWGQDRICKVSDIASKDLLFLWTFPSQVSYEGPVSLLVSVKELLLQFDDSSLDSKKILKHLKKISKKESLKFPEMMKLLRIVISGLEEGPPVLEMIEILGLKTVLERIDKAILQQN